MKINNKSIILSILILITAVSVMHSESILTLEGAVELALKNNRNLLIMEKEIAYADAQISEAYGAAFPVIAVNLGSKHQDKVRTMTLPAEEGTINIPMGRKDNYFGNLSITQPLWVGGKVGAALEGARLFKQFMFHNYQDTRQYIIYATKLSYYSVMLANAAVDISRRALEQSEKHYEQVKNLFEQGMASRFDYLRAEVAVSNNKPAYLQAKNHYELSLIQLKNIMGIDLDEEIMIIEEMMYHPMAYCEQDVLEQAYRNREDLRAIEMQIEMNQTIERIYRADYYPSLFFISEYSATRDKSARNDIYGELSGSFVLRWNFNFGTRGRIMQSEIRVRQSLHQKEQLKADIQHEVKEAFLKLKEAESIILSQEKAVSLAEEALQIAEVRYQSGTGTHLEVADAQFSLNLARTNYIQALFGYYVSKTNIEKVTGIL